MHSVIGHEHCCLFYICKALNPEKLEINRELRDFKWFSGNELYNKEIPLDVRNIGLRAFKIYKEKNSIL